MDVERVRWADARAQGVQEHLLAVAMAVAQEAGRLYGPSSRLERARGKRPREGAEGAAGGHSRGHSTQVVPRQRALPRVPVGSRKGAAQGGAPSQSLCGAASPDPQLPRPTATQGALVLWALRCHWYAPLCGAGAWGRLPPAHCQWQGNARPTKGGEAPPPLVGLA